MNIDDHSFHDAEILKVTEVSGYQILEFLLDFPVDWKRNIFEHRILRFEDVTNYLIKEIPFKGNPTILEVKEFGTTNTTLGSGRNEMSFTRKKVELITNAGSRVIDYLKCDLLKP